MSTPGSSLGRPGSWARPGSPRGSDFGLQFPPTIYVSGSPRGSDCLLNFIFGILYVRFIFEFFLKCRVFDLRLLCGSTCRHEVTEVFELFFDTSNYFLCFIKG